MARKGENIFKRKDGRWEARYILFYEHGTPVYRYLYGKTYKEAKEKRLKEQSLPTITQIVNTQSQGSFGQLSAQWLAQIQSTVKESTYTRYVRTVEVYLLPNIGTYQLKGLSHVQINQMTAMFLKCGGVNSNSLAPKTVSDILCVLKSILAFGKSQGYYCPNLGEVKYPSKNVKPTKILSEQSRDKIEELLFYSEDSVHLGILFALFTGVRIGELCGLQWGDFNFDNQTVSITRTVSRIANLDPLATSKTKIIITTPKTNHGSRIIPLPQFLVNKLFLAKKGRTTYLLTGTVNPTEPQRYYVQYRRFLEKNGLELQSFHSLRHSFATQCVEQGFDIKSLSEILGHADVKTTLALYVHPSLKQKQEQMNRLAPKCL